MKTWRNGMLVALAWCLGVSGLEAQTLVINEVLASNSSFDYDDFFNSKIGLRSTMVAGSSIWKVTT